MCNVLKMIRARARAAVAATTTTTTNRNQFCPPFPTFCHVFLVAGHVRALFGASPPRNASPYHPLLLPTSLSLSHAPPLTLTLAASVSLPSSSVSPILFSRYERSAAPGIGDVGGGGGDDGGGDDDDG